MDITIPAQTDSCVSKELKFELGKYTIFAGENNAGKTNLMKALRKVLPEDRTIYIPAESVIAVDHLKTGSKEDPMRDAFLKLVEVNLAQMPTVNYASVEGFLNSISSTFGTYNVKNISLDLSVKKLTETDIKKIIKDEVSKKILSSVIKDTYGAGCDLTIEDVGQGTQRLIIAATLQELSRSKIASGEELFLIFEEPEIYLHPKLKQSLYQALLEMSENNVKVILTTHDPYFIELGADHIIHNVFRDDTGATSVSRPLEGILTPSTHAEINYVIFEVPSSDYLLQLYQKALEGSVPNFEKYNIDGVSVYDIRAGIAHRTEKKGRREKTVPDITEKIKKETIDYLRSVIA